MADPAFEDRPPGGDQVTDYDRHHHRTYWRILDAEAEQADWREVVAVVFGIDPAAEPGRARTVYDAHLARARWMSDSGYRQLL
jgi:hypothetical protein